MENFTPTPFKGILPQTDKKGNIILKKSIEKKEFTIIKHYDVNSPASLCEKKAEDLFGTFTANIIKEETLFIR